MLYYPTHLGGAMSEGQQRRYPRMNLRDAVSYQLDELEPFQGSYGRDVSMGGACIELDRFVKVGTQMTVRMQMPNTQQVVEAKARVSWVSVVPESDRYRVGIVFEQFISGQPARTQNYAQALRNYN